MNVKRKKEYRRTRAVATNIERICEEFLPTKEEMEKMKHILLVFGIFSFSSSLIFICFIFSISSFVGRNSSHILSIFVAVQRHSDYDIAMGMTEEQKIANMRTLSTVKVRAAKGPPHSQT